jgi:hypothetical protein
MIKRLLTVCVAMLLLVSSGLAQTAQTGAINGTVTDPDGVTLPGVTVILKSPALILPQLTTVTNANGLYRFPLLEPGTYEITFMLEGMNILIRKGIVVSIGKTSSVDVGMTLKSLEESIVVSGKAPTIDRQSTVGAANLDEEFLQSVPVSERDFMDYFNLTPGVTGDTAHGSGQRENAYTLDGVNMGDPATGTDYVGFGMDIMEEISVQSGGLTAEHGSVKGAVVNVVTKSGGNKFSGSASVYYNHESLQSENVEGTDLYDPDGPSDKTGEKFKFEPGLTLGGPLIKDKLWFFGNLSMITKETYAPGFPYDKAPGEEDKPVDEKRFFPYFKFTFHPNQQNKFMLSYNYSDRRRNNRGAAWYNNEDTTVTQASPTHVVNLHWTRFFGENVYANLKLAAVKYEMRLHAKKPGTHYSTYSTGYESGSYWRNMDDNKRDRYQVNLDATTFIDDLGGSHEIKIGAEMQLANVGWLIDTYAEEHPYGLSYVVVAPAYFGEPGYYQGYIIYGFDRKDRMLNLSAFLQDTWSITNNLTLNLGLRFDRQSMIWPAQNQDGEIFYFGDLVIDRRMPESITAMKWNNLSPRVGLIYDIFSDGTTLFKASWSRYVQPNMTEWVNTAHPNGWYGYLAYLDHDTGQPIAGTERIWNTPSTVTIGYPQGNQDLTAPYVDELTVGLEREMWEDWSLGLRYIKKWDKNMIQTVDASRLDMDALINNGELVWMDFQQVNLFDPYSGQNVMFYDDLDPYRIEEEYIMNPPGAKRYYDGLELTINKRYSHGWALNASYVYANSRGLISTSGSGQAIGRSGLYHSPNAHINADGRFPYERRHQVKLTGLVKGPWGINLSGYFRYLSGRRWTRVVSSDYLGYIDVLGQGNVTINAEERGASGYPAITMLDLRVEKAFKIKNVQLKVFADVFNVFNSNTNTTIRTDSSDPNYPFMEATAILDPRVVRLGAKIEFN